MDSDAPASRRWRCSPSTRRSRSPACRPTSCRASSRRSTPTACCRPVGRQRRRSSGTRRATGTCTRRCAGRGMLDTLLECGFRFAMISNADNLGATVDPRIAAHLAREQIPFLMEVVQGTEADRKGGHLARRRSDGRLVLRETAQTPPEDQESFRDYRRWRWYNTNTLWFDLTALARALADGRGLELPVILNRKTLDPRDPSSPAVLQLESAMGAAIGSFPGARLLCVPRIPVRSRQDDRRPAAAALRRLHDGRRASGLAPAPGLDGRLPYVELDPRHYKLIDDFERRLPTGRRRCAKPSGSSSAGTSRSAAVSSSAAPSTINAPEPRVIEAGTVLEGWTRRCAASRSSASGWSKSRRHDVLAVHGRADRPGLSRDRCRRHRGHGFVAAATRCFLTVKSAGGLVRGEREVEVSSGAVRGAVAGNRGAARREGAPRSRRRRRAADRARRLRRRALGLDRSPRSSSATPSRPREFGSPAWFGREVTGDGRLQESALGGGRSALRAMRGPAGARPSGPANRGLAPAELVALGRQRGRPRNGERLGAGARDDRGQTMLLQSST